MRLDGHAMHRVAGMRHGKESARTMCKGCAQHDEASAMDPGTRKGPSRQGWRTRATLVGRAGAGRRAGMSHGRAGHTLRPRHGRGAARTAGKERDAGGGGRRGRSLPWR